MTEQLVKFASGATRTVCRTAYSLIPPAALRALAERYWIGKVIHGPTNWMGGIPFSVCIDHLGEHLERFKARQQESRTVTPKDGSESFEYVDSDVENLAAIMWGAAAMIHYIDEGRVALDDRPYGVSPYVTAPEAPIITTIDKVLKARRLREGQDTAPSYCLAPAADTLICGHLLPCPQHSAVPAR